MLYNLSWSKPERGKNERKPSKTTISIVYMTFIEKNLLLAFNCFHSALSDGNGEPLSLSLHLWNARAWFSKKDVSWSGHISGMISKLYLWMSSSVCLRSPGVAEHLEQKFQKFTDSAPEESSSLTNHHSSFHFSWGKEDGSDGPSMYKKRLECTFKKDGFKYLCNRKYWHPELRLCPRKWVITNVLFSQWQIL